LISHDSVDPSLDAGDDNTSRVTLAQPRPTGGHHTVTFLVCNALYYGLARHLPFSVRPYAFGARRIRYEICRRMFRSCGTNVNVEHGALINSGADIEIGDNSGIGLNAYITGPLVIGRDVVMGPGCTLIGMNRNSERVDIPMIGQGYQPTAPPIIEDDVWIGANVTILPGRRIGTGSIVGAGAIVTRDVPPYALVGGNPARVISYRTPTGDDRSTFEASRYPADSSGKR
jgi:maltose O-acetyltransferase